MQIYYCDGCQLRIDIDEEGVRIGDKVFCKACATSKGLPTPRPSARAGTSGFNRGITNVQQRTTPSGSQRSAQSIAGLPRGTPGQGARRPSQSGEKIPARKSNSNAPPVIVHEPADAEPSSVLHEAANNPMLVYGLAGGGLLMAAFGVFLISNSAAPAVHDKPPTAEIKPNDPKPIPKPDSIKPLPDNIHQNGGPLGMLTSNGDSDPKEDYARRELDKIIEQEKSGKLQGMPLYKRYEGFVNSSARGTKAAKDAEAKLKSLPNLTPRIPENPAKTAPGISAVYYEWVNGSMTESASRNPLGKTTVKNIDFENEHKLEMSFGKHDFIFIRFTGFVQIPADGIYTFYAESDDGSQFYIGDDLLIENGGEHPPLEKSETLPLKAGKHKFRFDYYQGTGGGCVYFRWAGPGFDRQIVPESALSN